MTGGIILFLIAVLFCLFLRMKVGVRIIYEKDLQMFLKIGPLMLRIYPGKAGKNLEEKPAAKTKTEEKKEERPASHVTLAAVRRLIDAILPSVLDAMQRVRRGIHIHVMRLELIISDEDPAVAAQRFGTVQAVLWPGIALVENLVTVEKRDVRTNLDFAAQKSSASGELFVTMRIFRGIGILVRDGIPLLRGLMDFLKEIKSKGPKDQKKETKTDAAQVNEAAASLQ